MATNREVEMGFEFLDAMPRYRRVDANTRMMSDAVHAENKKITPEVLHQIFARIKPQLAMNPEYAQAYQAFFERHPEYGLECNMAILDATLIKLRESITAESLEELLMPGNPHSVLDKLAITAAAQEAKAEAKRLKDEAEHQARETDRMIAEITGYMLDTSGKVKFEYQREYKGKVAGLRSMPFADLQKRYNDVMTGREACRTPVEAVRAAVKTDAKAQRKELFSIEPPEVDLVNPKTGDSFMDRKELVNFLNSLSRLETRQFFFHPEGRPKKGVQEAVTQILNGMDR